MDFLVRHANVRPLAEWKLTSSHPKVDSIDPKGHKKRAYKATYSNWCDMLFSHLTKQNVHQEVKKVQVKVRENLTAHSLC